MAEPHTPLFRALRTVVRWIEGAAVFAAFGIFRLMPLDWASALGGRICRTIGRFLPVSRYAEKNLRAAFPEKSDAEIRKILADMWENLGRVFGEYPHLGEIRLYEPGSRVEVINPEYLDHLREDGKPGIFFSAHIGNWEIASMGATQRALPLTRIYRAPNNPLVDRLIRWTRRKITGELLPKGEEGARRAVAMMRKGEHLGMLID